MIVGVRAGDGGIACTEVEDFAIEFGTEPASSWKAFLSVFSSLVVLIWRARRGTIRSIDERNMVEIQEEVMGAYDFSIF